MARIRVVEIRNFRGIKELVWYPEPGINCLIGQGDSGKSSIIDSIDLCLGARRNVSFTDADFHLLNVEMPITIEVTLGELDDGLKSFDAYGMYFRGFNAETKSFEDEPEKTFETTLTVKLTVSSDLEPQWTLVSGRSENQGLSKNLIWGDRVRLAPSRIGTLADYHLGWRYDSVLNRLSGERADLSSALAKVARDARAAFGDEVQEQMKETLGIVTGTAKELGISFRDSVTAMLDAHSVSFRGGNISLHDEKGVPLRGLGTGSTRLLIAGLLRRATQSSIILIDEIEHGLEPHRIIRFLDYLGAKEEPPPLQTFMTTHSPVVLQELSGNQLFVSRGLREKHEVCVVGDEDDIQSTIRCYPEAFLASRIILCEGASEVGLIRGLDQYFTTTMKKYNSITARGVALVDCNGVDKIYKRAKAFHALGYCVMVVRDDDKKPTISDEKAFVDNDGKVVAWRSSRALEDELFLSMSDSGVSRLLERAVELQDECVVDNHIKSKSDNAENLSMIRHKIASGKLDVGSRVILGKAARTRKTGWFKSLTWMEDASRDIIGPDIKYADEGFKSLVRSIFVWKDNDRK